MKKCNSLYLCMLAILFSYSLNAMHVQGPQIGQAHFTGPIDMHNPVLTTTTNHNYNRYANYDFGNGNPNAGFFRKMYNAARESVPAMVYRVPTSLLEIATHVTASVTAAILTHKASQWLLGGNESSVNKESEAAQIQKIDALVIYFTDKLAHLSVNSPEYTATKQKIDLLKNKYKDLEDKLFARVCDDVLKN